MVKETFSKKDKHEYIIKQKLCDLPMDYANLMINIATVSDAQYSIKIMDAEEKGQYKKANELKNTYEKEKLERKNEHYAEAEKVSSICHKKLKVKIVKSNIQSNVYLLDTRVELGEEIQNHLKFHLPTVDLKVKLNKIFDGVSVDTICYDKKVIYPLPSPDKVVNNQCF